MAASADTSTESAPRGSAPPASDATAAQAAEGLAAAIRPWIAASVVSAVLVGLVVLLASPGMRVLWFKSLHVIAVISWFAGIFYLPRLFVYHASVPDEDAYGHDRFCIMERKLYRFITPFLVLTTVFGIAMLVEYGYEYFRINTWLHVKIALVVGLIGYHFWLGYHGRAVRLGTRTRDHKFYRVVNELPVLVLFGVVILVIVKPF